MRQMWWWSHSATYPTVQNWGHFVLSELQKPRRRFVFMVNAAMHIKAAFLWIFQLFVPPWKFNYSWTCLWVNFWVFVSSAVPWRIHSCSKCDWLFACVEPGLHTVFEGVEFRFNGPSLLKASSPFPCFFLFEKLLKTCHYFHPATRNVIVKTKYI